MLDSSRMPAFFFTNLVVLSFGLILNLFALSAVIKTPFGLTSYRGLLISIAVSDLFFCCICMGFYSVDASWMLINSGGATSTSTSSNANPCTYVIFRGFLLSSVFVTLFSLIGMSVDHFIGIVHPLWYRYVRSPRSRDLSNNLDTYMFFCRW